MSDYYNDALAAKTKLATVSDSFCLAKWKQVSLHLTTGHTNSCYHPPLHKIGDAKDPTQWIESGPHLMLLPADPSSLDGMSDNFNTGAPYVMFPGTPGAHVMIPTEGYYHYQDPQ